MPCVSMDGVPAGSKAPTYADARPNDRDAWIRERVESDLWRGEQMRREPDLGIGPDHDSRPELRAIVGERGVAQHAPVGRKLVEGRRRLIVALFAGATGEQGELQAADGDMPAI